MVRLVTACVTLLALCCVVSGRSPPYRECLPLPCAAPDCDDYKIGISIQNGRECPGCPICPPDDNCASLQTCEDLACPLFVCPGAQPTCQFKDGAFCRGCDSCPTCDSVDCPSPPKRCDNMVPLEVGLGQVCEDCRVCVDNLLFCPDTICPRLDCPQGQRKQHPRLRSNGNICLGCETCECPVVTCTKCDEVNPDWEPIYDNNGCQTNCPACKVEDSICRVIRCQRPEPLCQTLSMFRGPAGEVCGCANCADEHKVCRDFDCPELPRDCANKPLHDLVEVNGRECLSCPVCSDFPKCEPVICPLCAPPPGWVQPVDQNGCPVGCPPCGTVCPVLDCLDCGENGVEPGWEPILDNNGCQTSCPTCRGPGICDRIDCAPIPRGCDNLANVRGENGEICSGCVYCVDSMDVCSQFNCDPEPKDCDNRPLYRVVELGGEKCLSCPICSTIPKCEPLICPECVPPPGWVQQYDDNGCPVGCHPCGTSCPVLDCPDCGENGVEPGWEPVLDKNGCQTSCPACRGPGICATIFCGRPDATCNTLSNLRGENGEVCQACFNCVDNLEVCAAFECNPLPDDCENKPVHDVVKIGRDQCLSCPTCSIIAKCPPLICPACVTVDDFVSPVDANGCPTQCAPCKVELPICWWSRYRVCDEYVEARAMRCRECRRGGRYISRQYPG